MTGSIGTTSTGGVFIGGTSSGINTKALIDAAVAQKTRRADRLQVEVDGNSSTIGAYSKLQSLTDNLESALALLRGPKSVSDDTKRVFDQRAGTVSTSDGSDFKSYIDVAVEADAIPGSYEVEVLEAARVERIGSISVVDETAALGYTGTFDLGLSGVGTASINVSATDSLQDVRDLVNAQTATTGVAASILKVSETEYQLIFSGNQTNASIVSTYTGGDDVLDLLGIKKQTFGTMLLNQASGTFGSVSGIVNNASTQHRITFTTPAAGSASVPGQVIFESGGSAQGIGLYLDGNNQLAVYAGNATSVPRVLSPDVLQPNTQYSVVVEFDDASNEIRLHYEQSGDFNYYYSGRNPEAKIDGFAQSNLSGGNTAGVGVLGGGSYGGFNGTASGPSAFQGTIDSNYIISSIPPAGSSGIFEPATGGRISFDGVEVTRDDNAFDDLTAGIDITTKTAAPGTKINLEITNDTTAVKDAIVGFVDSYNAIRDFVVQNQQVSSSGVVAKDAILFGDNLLGGLADTLSALIGSDFGSGSIQTIRDLGIQIGKNNRLEIIDESILDTAILNNFDAVRAAFASNATTNNSEFALIGNKSSIGTTSIVFDLTTDGAGNITGATANGDATAFTFSGGTLTGAVGTIYEGLTFSYQGTDLNATITADLTQGLADRILNSISGYTNPATGLLAQEKLALGNENDQKLQEAKEIRARAEEFRAAQIEKYAKLESDLAALNTLLDQIRAILGTDRDDK